MAEAELERREGDDSKDGWYLLAYGDEYFVSRHNRIEFVDFEYRLSSLAWLRAKIAKSIDAELTELREARESGSHRVAGWEGESDMMLDESTYVLDTSTRQISAGVIVVAAVAALESLMNRLLDQPGDEDLHRAGLTRKARVLAERWQDSVDRQELEDHVSWLRERRNSFAHRLIDNVDPQWRSHPATWDFDDEAADEALERISAAAWLLEEGWEQHLTSQRADARYVP
ncbi:hypothetical protein ACFUJR_17700 [Streptomyces sp. NPDC057271]|uniref:hypothetical protein n=1 Tax=unclassified Streptomyces TaxID=2593676 RepID=UPI00362CDD27